MKENNSNGKIFFFKTDKSSNPKDNFSQLLEVNSNFDNLKSLNLTNGKAYGITINNELLEWEFEKKKTKKNISSLNPENSENSQNNTQSSFHNKKTDYYFLLSKPSYRFHKMKIKSLALNKTMCLSLDINGNVYVWGQNKDGLLGLGYEVNSVENPTILDGLTEIVDISLSDNHAVALNSSGIPFSWGLGKYGELGLERSIYSPVPQQMNTESIYSRVFCGNLITCFLDFEGHFSYFGVIIKQLGGNSSTVTTKNLLNDQNIDSKSIFLEKEFEELEDQKFKEIVIGNGFIALLGNTGTLFTLEYNDKLTMLYSKYYLYNIVVAKNEIFGLAKDNVKIMENKNDNINEDKLINSTNEEKIKTNYYLCRWSSKSSSENEVCSDTWISTIWKFKDEFTNIIENGKLLDTNDNRNILLLLDSDAKYSNNLNTSVLNPNKKLLDLSTTNNELSMLNMTMNNNTTITENIMMFNLNRKKIPEKILEYEAEFDDTFNLKYKRTKAKSKSILKDLPYIGTIRSRSVSRILNKSYNASFQNSAINLNKSNFMNFGNNNNISAIGPNTSTFLNKKSVLIPTSNNYKKTSGKIFTNNLHNYNNLSNQNNNSKNKNNYFTQNSKSSFSLNNNDISKDNNDIDNNFNISGNNFSASNYKNNQKEKDNDNVNIYDQSIDVKERELNKYRSEIDDIIANYKNKQSIKKNNLLNKYGLSKENNINITNQNRQENYINNQNISRDNFLDINIKDQIENSNNKNNFNDINIENDSPFKMDLNKRYDAENDLNNNIMNISIKDKKNKYDKEKINNNLNLFKRIVQSSEKKNPNKNEIMKNIQYYFKINKVNSKNRNKRKNYKGIRSENEIEFNMNREETFQNVNNNDIKGKSNSFIINNPLNLFISNSDISNIIPTKCLSEGNDILHDDEYSNEDSNNIRREENKYANNNFEMNQNNNKKEINIIENNNNLDYFDNELISSPAFNNGNMQKNRLSDLIINEANKNKDKNGKNIGFNLQYNNKNKDIKKEKNNNSNNLAIKSTVYTNTNNNTNKNSRFSFGNNSNIKNNVKQNINNSNINNNKQENSNTNLIIQNINKINLKSDKKENNINAETNKNNINNNINNKEIKDIKQNKVKITKNNNINQKIKSLDSNQPKNNNIKKYIINNKIPKNLNNQQKNIQNNNKETNKNKNQIKNEEENTEKNKNFKKQNMEDYNFDDINEDQKIISKLNNRKQVENNKNNKIYKKENIYSYEIGENNKKNVYNSNNNYTIDNINNNVNYQNEDIDNNSRINKSSVSYFVYVLTKYLQKKCYLLCAYEIANFQKKYEKNLSLKLLFVVIKKRIIFYKIKFFHRYKKIYKYLVKYKKNNNDISGYNQKKKENKISGNKK